MENDDLLAAVLLGTASGLRTFSGAATLAASGRLRLAPKLRTALMLAAAGELVGDKLPFTPARTAALPYLGRIAAGTISGAKVAGPRGGMLAAATSAAATQAGYRARRYLTTRRGAKDLFVALLEDTIALGTARIATQITAPGRLVLNDS
jgi:uncharacterized membrane protein